MASPPPLKVYFIPYLAAGHMIPLCDIASLFASRGQHVTVITTPSNAKLLLHKSNPHFHIHTVPFPSQEVGLPDGLETMTHVSDLANSSKIHRAAMLLRGPIHHFLEHHPPDCIVVDFMISWADDVAKTLRIPRLAFNGFSLFTVCAMESLRTHPLPDSDSGSGSGSFLIPDFPHHISICSRPPKIFTEFIERLLGLELKSNGLIVNSFVELDGEECLQHYQKSAGHRAWHLGPVSLIRRSSNEEHECVSWLDSKAPNSVLYICFGSTCRFSDEQLYEMACGIEQSGHPFIWVVPGKEEDERNENKWLPEGFEERTKMNGIIIRGWAPQVLILTHPAVGAFLTHCGWNSTVEAVSTGVPMITWPVHGEQFYNEKLITEVRGIGVEVGVDEWSLSGHVEREKLVGREKIKKGIRRLMDGGDEADQIRCRAQQFGTKAREALQEGGSSHRSLTDLIDHLKRLRDCKSLD